MADPASRNSTIIIRVLSGSADDRRRLAAYITMMLKQTDVPALVIVPEDRDPDQEAV
jgi:hypothetical protein